MSSNGHGNPEQDMSQPAKISPPRAAPDISESVRRLGIDLPYLRTLPRGGSGRAWPADWAVAAQLLYVNGWSASEVSRHLGGPTATTIEFWALRGGWNEKREQHRKSLAEKSMAKMEEGQAAITARHLKYTRALESKAVKAIVTESAEAKSLEGMGLTLLAAMKFERSVLGIEHAPVTKVEDNRTQVWIAEMNALNPEQLRAYFDAMRAKLMAESTIQELVAGSVIEGEVVDGGEPGASETPQEDSDPGNARMSG